MTSPTKEDRATEKPHGLERMIFFSDAVIAIMLTLLALELPVPHVDSATQLWHALAGHSAEYIAFLISFSVIAATWTARTTCCSPTSAAPIRRSSRSTC